MRVTGRKCRRGGAVARRFRQLAGLAVLVLFCLFPAYWMVVSSLTPHEAIFSNALLPRTPSLENFRNIFGEQNNFALALRNSAIIAGGVTAIAMLIGMGSAYALVRLRFRRKRLVALGVLALSMFPAVAIVTPLFQLFSKLQWIDQYQAIIVPNVGFALPLCIWIFIGFFSEVPWELEQAAMIDGCTRWQAFWRVMCPLLAPGVFTAAILIFVHAWSEYLVASIMSQTLASEPVTVAIAHFAGDSEFQQPFGSQMAAGVVVTLPLTFVIILLQRRVVTGLTAGALKG
jgi:multiple sugar transport system permease protein